VLPVAATSHRPVRSGASFDAPFELEGISRAYQGAGTVAPSRSGCWAEFGHEHVDLVVHKHGISASVTGRNRCGVEQG
jgi:hypothetical protein